MIIILNSGASFLFIVYLVIIYISIYLTRVTTQRRYSHCFFVLFYLFLFPPGFIQLSVPRYFFSAFSLPSNEHSSFSSRTFQSQVKCKNWVYMYVCPGGRRTKQQTFATCKELGHFLLIRPRFWNIGA